MRTWTDRKWLAPMLRLPPEVVVCHQCKEAYWLQEAREVGQIHWFHTYKAALEPLDPTWEEAPAVREPGERGYYRAIARGLATNPEQERTARILAWWRRNEKFRNGISTKDPRVNPATKKNLRHLLPLLDETDESTLLMKAEVYRELGEFEAAGELLDRIVSPESAGVVAQMRALCEARDVCVRMLAEEDSWPGSAGGGIFM